MGESASATAYWHLLTMVLGMLFDMRGGAESGRTWTNKKMVEVLLGAWSKKEL